MSNTITTPAPRIQNIDPSIEGAASARGGSASLDHVSNEATPTIFTASSGAELEAALLADPRFAAKVKVMEAAMQQKENAQALLDSKAGALDEKTMAIYTEANKRSDQLVNVATNIQKSDNDMIDTLARNVG